MELEKCFEIIMKGRVQKVMFRDFTNRVADKLNIRGFIKNQNNGNVFIKAVGKDSQINTFIEEVKKGDLLSKVESVDIKECNMEEFNNFSIKYE